MGKTPVNKLTINIQDSYAQDKICSHVVKLITNQEGYTIRPIVVLCIGSDRYTGDALGPLVGSYLMEKTDAVVYGSLDHPVHAGNLVDTIRSIEHQYYRPIIIAVDACLGRADEVGNIEVWEGGLHAGIAVGNKLPYVGNISVIGVVNYSGQIGYLDLQSTPLSIVMKLSKAISMALERGLQAVGIKASSAVF